MESLTKLARLPADHPTGRCRRADLGMAAAVVLLLGGSCSPLTMPPDDKAELKRQLLQDCPMSDLHLSGNGSWADEDTTITISGRCPVLFGGMLDSNIVSRATEPIRARLLSKPFLDHEPVAVSRR